MALGKKFKKLTDKQYKKIKDDSKEIYKIYFKFYKFLSKNFGSGLKKDESFDYKLSERLSGFEVMEKIDKYVKLNSDIKIVKCDDSFYSTSYIILVPLPKMAIRMFFVPQCTEIKNEIILGSYNIDNLFKELYKMKKKYKIKN